MYATRIPAAALAMLLCAGSTALAQGGVTIRVLNDTPDNLIVTLYDRSAHPPQPVVSGEIIDGNASISVSITADASGQGHLSWTAATVGRDMRRCGHRGKRAVNDGDTIRVFADHRCTAR